MSAPLAFKSQQTLIVNKKMELKKIDEYEYRQMLNSKLCSKQDMFRLASYPYVSLLSKYKNLISYEQRKIREIEDDSVFAFFHIISLLFGVGSQSEIDTINRNMNVEPLRSAVIAARQEIDPAERAPKYFELACKILLSLDERGYSMMNVINIRVRGKIPGMPFSNRQKIADEWFSTFVNLKLEGMKKVYRELSEFENYCNRLGLSHDQTRVRIARKLSYMRDGIVKAGGIVAWTNK